jgi:ketosteroid isomerase-like protein
MKVSVALLFVGLIMATTLAFADSDEEIVWSLEESYWAYVKNNDIDGYLMLWDDRFVGWPCGNLKPATKENIADWIPALHSNPLKIYEYELTREAVRSFGDTVVAHYLVRDWYRSAETEELTEEGIGRITHTWQKRGDIWQIITGMCGTWVGDTSNE